jgi:hypothetical protein
MPSLTTTRPPPDALAGAFSFLALRCCYTFTMNEEEELLLLSVLTDQLESPPSFRKTLNLQSRRLKRGAIRRAALLPPSQSAFAHLFNSGQDDALVTMRGFDHQSTMHPFFSSQ